MNNVIDINLYLDSLSEDIEEIDVSDKGLDYLPDLTRFKNLKILNCQHNNLTFLPSLNQNLEELFCFDNELTFLPYLNDNLKMLNCSCNKLIILPLLNKNLEFIKCSNNRLTELPSLNKKLEYINCSSNQLCYLPSLNENLQTIFFSDNPIHEIINTYDKSIINQKVKILNNFRFLYYCLKFKKQFRDWLWMKIREPKIQKKYHYRYLL
jgi:Leucine-rich repeat (LRR) protein